MEIYEQDNKTKGKNFQVNAFRAEKIIETRLNHKDVKTKRLIIADKIKRLDVEGLNLFLKDYSQKDTLISLLKKLKSEKVHFPDFICIEKGCEKPHFVEVKNKRIKEYDFSFLKTKQKRAINALAENGYSVIIVNVNSFNTIVNDPKTIKMVLKQISDTDKGILEEEREEIEIKLNEEISEIKSPYKNIVIVNYSYFLEKINNQTSKEPLEIPNF